MLKVKIIDLTTGNIKKTICDTTAKHDFLLGRHDCCDIVLDSEDVSNGHARVFIQDSSCFFIDHSTNGSTINNQEVNFNQRVLLKIGDTIRIGDWLLLIENFPEATPSQASSSLPETLNARCVQIIKETADVKTFWFIIEPQINFSYQPGQFITLKLNIGSETVYRCYSLSSSPSRPDKIAITVKRIPSGKVSNWLHNSLKEGDRIGISPPMGNFTCVNPPNPKLLLISAGSGITPMMSMSRWLHDRAESFDVVFLHSARTYSDLIFKKELELIADQSPNFNLNFTLTQPEPTKNWLGFRGRLNEKTLRIIAPDFKERTVYVCGPDSFMQATKNILDKLGFPMKNYFQESFGSEPVKPLPRFEPETTSMQSTVVFAKSNREIICNEETSILDIAQQQGLSVRSSCRQGICGACRLHKSEGNINYSATPEALDETQKQAGYFLSCIAYPAGNRIVINL